MLSPPQVFLRGRVYAPAHPGATALVTQGDRSTPRTLLPTSSTKRSGAGTLITVAAAANARSSAPQVPMASWVASLKT